MNPQGEQGVIELVPGRRLTRTIPAPVHRRPAVRVVRAWLRDAVGPRSPWSYLAPDELCLIRTHLHWLVPLRAIAKAAVSMPLAIVVTLLLAFLAPGWWWLQVALWVGTVAHQCYLIWLVLLWRAEQIIVTDRRLIRISGVFTTTVDDVRLSQITDTSYRRSLLGRIFDYGSIRIESAGQVQALERIDFVPSPGAIYRATLS